MKKRRIFVFGFLLIATLLIGVGYAAVSKHLQISGISSVTALTSADFDVVFVAANDAADTTSESGVKVASNSIQSSDGHVVILSLSDFKELNDTITLTYDVQYTVKEDGINAELTEPSCGFVSEANGSFFNVQCSFDDSTLTAADDTSTLTVTITLVKVPTDDLTVDYKITFSANAVTAE